MRPIPRRALLSALERWEPDMRQTVAQALAQVD